MFRERFFSYELGRVKKDPVTFTMVLQRIKRQPEECLLIDDSPVNIASAESVGIKGIRFENAVELTNRLVGMNLL